MRNCLIFILVLMWSSLVFAEQVPSVRYMLGQKLMLDLRYFCPNSTPAAQCRTPVTVLPDALANLISEEHIGGVILFSENIQNASQLKALTTALQNTQPELLFIATDQEGGRVARLPSEYLPAYGGSMALGSVPEALRLTLAKDVAVHTGNALREAGINVNFAPTVDVNSNPENPVINVRSFGDDPHNVAKLGFAMTEGLLSSGVLPALKHFPGHGDTFVDSHAGLPVVTHDTATIMQTDIYPFAQIITQTQEQINHAQRQIPMVMTAHIQYPALDSSTLKVQTDAGIIEVIRPATLSKTILTEVLRKEMGFNGLIVTDALDMAGITQFFGADTAVLETWRAGSDIALMPYTIRTPDDIVAFKRFLDQIEAALTAPDKAQMLASFGRIAQTKQHLNQYLTTNRDSALSQSTVQQHIQVPRNNDNVTRLFVAYDKTAAVEMAFSLARHSVTTIQPILRQLHHKLTTFNAPKLLMIMPDELRCQGLLQVLLKIRPEAQLTCLTTAVREAWSPEELALNTYDAVFWGELSPAQSVVEMGGMEDWQALRQAGQTRATIAEQHALLDTVLHHPSARSKLILFGLRAPYAVLQRSHNRRVAGAFVLFDYRVVPDTLFSPTLTVFAEHLLLGKSVFGELPVEHP